MEVFQAAVRAGLDALLAQYEQHLVQDSEEEEGEETNTEG